MKCEHCNKMALIKIKIVDEKKFANYCKSCYMFVHTLIEHLLTLKEIFFEAQAQNQSDKQFNKETLNWDK